MGKTLKNLLYGSVLALSSLFPMHKSEAAQQFIRGDVDGDGKISITDPINTLNYLFKGGQKPECEDAADVNDDGKIDLGDAISSLRYLFLGEEQPKNPFPEAGYDITRDSLDCKGQRDLENKIITQKDIPLVITESGTPESPLLYVLGEDVRAEGTTITIMADDIILDGQNHTLIYGVGDADDIYGIYLKGTKRNVIQNTNISEDEGNGRYKHAIHSISSVEGLIKNNTIYTSSISASGIFLDSSSRFHINKNDVTTLGGGDGIYLFNHSDLNSVEKNKINTLNKGGFGIALDFYSNFNNINANEVVTSGDYSYGILLFGQSLNNNLKENSIQTDGINSEAIYMSDLLNGNSFYDTSVSSAFANDIGFGPGASGTINFTNVTLANNRIGFQSGSTAKLNIHWYLDALVKDVQNRGIKDVRVEAYDKNNAQIFSSSTDFNGRIERQQILGAVYNAQGVVYPSYDLNATHPDYNNPATLHLDKIEGNIDWTAVLTN